MYANLNLLGEASKNIMERPCGAEDGAEEALYAEAEARSACGGCHPEPGIELYAMAQEMKLPLAEWKACLSTAAPVLRWREVQLAAASMSLSCVTQWSSSEWRSSSWLRLSDHSPPPHLPNPAQASHRLLVASPLC